MTLPDHARANRTHVLEILPRPLLLILPLFMLVAAAEGWYLQSKRGQRYNWRAFFASLGDAVGRRLIVSTIGIGVIAAILSVAWDYRITTMSMDRWWSWVLLLLGEEFCYYWMHRADHRIRWLWATHAVHHSSNQFVLANAYRLGWTAQISGALLFMTPLVLVGFSPTMVLTALGANLLYQFWIHTELIGSLGPLEWVLNTPKHHRVHHARNDAYLDRNFGGVLIVFDRLFGTFVEERADLPCSYGLVEPLTTNNPVRIAFHGWQNLWRALRDARGLRECAMALFGPPEWRPETSRSGSVNSQAR
jgi:sterol desaturase/sphingolipid hydroxylase (fatty acid hydroxylase superfamily)